MERERERELEKEIETVLRGRGGREVVLCHPSV